MHLVGTDREDAEADLLRRQCRRHQGHEGIRVLVIVRVPEGAESVVLRRDGDLRNLRRAQIRLEDDVNLHGGIRFGKRGV